MDIGAGHPPDNSFEAAVANFTVCTRVLFSVASTPNLSMYHRVAARAVGKEATFFHESLLH